MAELETASATELREQQRALGRVLRAVAQGEGLQPVLNQLIEEACRLCAGEYAELHLVEGEMLRAFSYYVASDPESPIAQGALEQWELGREQPHKRDPSTLAGRVALLEDVVNIPDMLVDPEYTFPLPAGTRAGLGVPIVLDGELIGTMGIVRDVRSPFTADIDLVRTFADQAAAVIKNARLLETVERQLNQRRAIGDVLRAIARSHDLQTVLDEIVQSAASLSGAENARLFLMRDELLHAVANFGSDENFDYDRQHAHPVDESTLTGRAASTRRSVHIPDVLEDSEYTYEGESGDLPYRSGVTVPILLDEELIGAIGIVSEQPRAFTDTHIELLETFADQAAVAIANARLINSVEQQLEQQQAISGVLGAVARSEGLESVFNAVVEAAARLCDAEHGQVHVADGEVYRLAGDYGSDPELVEYERSHPHVPDRTSVVGRVALSHDVEHIPDVLEDTEYGYATQSAGGFRAMLGVPIFVEGGLIGVINVVRNRPEPFTHDQIELVKTFADQAAIAVSNARLIDAVERQLEQQRAIADVLRAVARSEGLEAVFEVAVKEATRLSDGDWGGLYLADGDLFRLAVLDGGTAEHNEFEQTHPHGADRRTLVGRVAESRSIVQIPDVLADPEYSWPAQEMSGFRAMLGAPVLVEGELIAVIGVVRVEPKPFSTEQIDLVKTFADQAAIAIANARLIDAVERQRTELSRFVSPQVAELISSAEGERMLAGHRAYVSCLFCDLRGFTAFAQMAAPEELLDLLHEYHLTVGALIQEHEGTLEHFAGDGVMVFFNDPVPVERHELKAIRFALAAQEGFAALAVAWRKRGIELGLGVGIAAGYATLGRIGFEGRYDYGALGPVTNLASRLSSAAEPAQILIDQRVFAAVEDDVLADQVGEYELKGLDRPVTAFEVRGLR